MIDLINELTQILTDKEYPPISQSIIDVLFKKLADVKKKYVLENNQNNAKKVWIYEQILIIRLQYVNIWGFIKKRLYEKAWEEIVFCEKKIEYLEKHYDITEKNDIYHLEKIKTFIYALQKLFPYRIFMSPSYTIKKMICSICEEEINPFNRCKHKLREIYNGELCLYWIKDFDINEYAIVKNPRWKLRYVKPDKFEFDYTILILLADRIDDIFEGWMVRSLKLEFDHTFFTSFSENNYCPCGSYLSYGECCLKKKKVIVDAYEIQVNSKFYLSNIIQLRLKPIQVSEEIKDFFKGTGSILNIKSHYID